MARQKWSVRKDSRGCLFDDSIEAFNVRYRGDSGSWRAGFIEVGPGGEFKAYGTFVSDYLGTFGTKDKAVEAIQSFEAARQRDKIRRGIR